MYQNHVDSIKNANRGADQAGFGEYESHKRDHESLLDQINDMIFSFTEDPITGREMLTNELSGWFGRHFTTFDTRLHNQLED